MSGIMSAVEMASEPLASLRSRRRSRSRAAPRGRSRWRSTSRRATRSRRCSGSSASRCWSRRTRRTSCSCFASRPAGSRSSSARSSGRWGWRSTRGGSRWARATRSGTSATRRTSRRRSSRRACTTPASSRAASHVTGDIGVHEVAWGGRAARRAVARQHPLLLPVHAARRLQLRPALAAAVHHRAGGGRPLPPQRPGDRRRPAALRDRARSNRHARRAGAPTRRAAAS